jgi:hypothetical protein
VPCGVSTGFAGAETRIAVDTQNRVFTMATFPQDPTGAGLVPGAGPGPSTLLSLGGVAVTSNGGETWAGIRPLNRTWGGQDFQIHADPDTGRVFWETFHPGSPLQSGLAATEYGFGAYLLWTDDGGKTWDYALPPIGHTLPENPRFATNEAPPGYPKPQGYPNVVYWCANVGSIFVPVARDCAKSLDGGVTWERTGTMLSRGIPQHAECGSSGEEFGPTDGAYPQPGLHGALYALAWCGGETYLTKSTDEAATWPVIAKLPSIGGPQGFPVGGGYELRTDRRGNLYLAAEIDGKLMMRVSRNEGRTWSNAQNVLAPGVGSLGKWFMEVREVGHAAFAYYGGRDEGFDGYLTETRNALELRTIYYSARVNDRDRPLMYGADLQGAGALYAPDGQAYPWIPAPFVDYIGVAIGPDGTPWASFSQDCGPDPEDPTCRAQNGQSRGFVGRLLWPAPVPAPPRPRHTSG